MKITKSQQFRFFREWSAIVRAKGWPHDQAETERHALLRRAGFFSLKDVDHTHGFTAVLKELAILQENLQAMLHADQNPRRMLIHNIKAKADTSYWSSISRDRFGTDDLESLPDAHLQQLLYTVSDRAVAEHKNATLLARAHSNRARKAAPAQEARIKFPDLSPATADCPF